MEYGGTLPTDAPDPSVASETRLRSVPFPVFELRPQPAVTRAPITGFTEGSGPAGLTDPSVHLSYTLWHVPEDHDDPRNRREIDERTRRSIEEEPPWGRPAWLIEQARLHLYPTLWEATRTAWHASPDAERHSLSQQLVDHTNYVLQNGFREQLGIPAGPTRTTDWKVKPTAVAEATLEVDGEHRPAIHIDTDPFVYAVGFRVDEHTVSTNVFPRDSLPLLDLSLTTLV